MMDQEQYTVQILSDFGMEHCNAVKIPYPALRLSSTMCPSNDEERQAAAKLPCCALIRKFMYLSNCTRPDISFAVRELTQFMSNHGTKHFEAAKRPPPLPARHPWQRDHLRNSYPIFKAFADSDWAICGGASSSPSFPPQPNCITGHVPLDFT